MSAAWAYEYVMTAKSTKITYHYENNTQDTHTHTHCHGKWWPRLKSIQMLSFRPLSLWLLFDVIYVYDYQYIWKKIAPKASYFALCLPNFMDWWVSAMNVRMKEKKNLTMIFVFQLIIITTIIIIFHIYSCLFNAMKWNGMPCLSVLLFWSF